MSFWSTPPRQRGVEILDDPRTSDDDRGEAMSYLPWSNTLFGGSRAVLRVMPAALAELRDGATLLDVGTGMGDIAGIVAFMARHRYGVTLRTIGLDSIPLQADLARAQVEHAIVGDALSLPLATGSIDVVLCSQTLHHFFDGDAATLIRELHRVARGWVVISDLRRSRMAAAGFSIAARLLRFPAITRVDGVTSVMRGFTDDELSRLVLDATGVRPTVRRSRFWRLTAMWRKSSVR